MAKSVMDIRAKDANGVCSVNIRKFPNHLYNYFLVEAQRRTKVDLREVTVPDLIRSYCLLSVELLQLESFQILEREAAAKEISVVGLLDCMILENLERLSAASRQHDFFR